MKKSMKKNNKGFSLVELIVVVLIMAIIGVALAPQVMKWVGNARKSADVSSYDSMISTAQLAYAKEAVYKDCKGETYTVEIKSGGTTVTGGTDAKRGTFTTEMSSLVADWATVKSKVGTTYSFTITDGKVTKGTQPSDTMD